MASLVGTPGSSRFLGSPFHQALAETYRDGASIVFGADLQSILRTHHGEADDHDEFLEKLGVTPAVDKPSDDLSDEPIGVNDF